jgi:hypothetical protein
LPPSSGQKNPRARNQREQVEAIRSSQTSVHTRSTRRHIPVDGIFHENTCLEDQCNTSWGLNMRSYVNTALIQDIFQFWIWGSHNGGYEIFPASGETQPTMQYYITKDRTFHITVYNHVNRYESTHKYEIWWSHGGDYDECSPIRCDAM